MKRDHFLSGETLATPHFKAIVLTRTEKLKADVALGIFSFQKRPSMSQRIQAKARDQLFKGLRPTYPIRQFDFAENIRTGKRWCDPMASNLVAS